MYEIKVLSNEEFDQVYKSNPRYKYVDETNLGFADRQTGKAYVRQTNIHDLNKYLINHELEELEEEESAHEDPNGIRHKKGPKLFKDIILPALTGGLGGSGGGFLGSLFGGASGAMGGISGAKERVQQNSQVSFPDTGSYQPTSGASAPQFGGFGSSPLNLFGGQGSYTPASQNVPSSGSYSPSGLAGIPDEIKQKLSGNYAGRIQF